MKIGKQVLCAVSFIVVCSSAWAVELVLPAQLKESVEVVKCADEAGSWKCVLKNKTNRTVSLSGYSATGYDRTGVKIGADTISDTIEPSGASKVSFSTVGYAGNVAKIVIR